MSGNFAEMTTSTPFRDLLHAVNLRHGTDGFTSPSEGRRAEDFFRPKNPTVSAGCEPENLGTKGQHATSRSPKPLTGYLLNNQVRPVLETNTLVLIVTS
jgi:hypothetical protein